MALTAFKKAVAQSARRLGYEIVPSWRVHDLAFARHLRELLTLYKADIVIDVGANNGQYRDFLRTVVGFEGTIISYEPQPRCYQHLVERAQDDPKWYVRNFALGEAPAELTLNVMEGSTLSSFLQPEDTELGSFGGLNRVRETVKVPVVRLDEDLVASSLMQDGERAYLKIDTQGFDLHVIRGATAAFSSIVAIQTELSVKPLYKEMPRYNQVLEVIEDLGFELSGLFPVNSNGALALIEIDGVFINPALAPTTTTN